MSLVLPVLLQRTLCPWKPKCQKQSSKRQQCHQQMPHLCWTWVQCRRPGRWMFPSAVLRVCHWDFQAADLINKAKRPILYVGQGHQPTCPTAVLLPALSLLLLHFVPQGASHCPEIVTKLAHKAQIPVTTTASHGLCSVRSVRSRFVFVELLSCHSHHHVFSPASPVPWYGHLRRARSAIHAHVGHAWVKASTALHWDS